MQHSHCLLRLRQARISWLLRRQQRERVERTRIDIFRIASVKLSHRSGIRRNPRRKLLTPRFVKRR
jgi:hypothetical protein